MGDAVWDNRAPNRTGIPLPINDDVNKPILIASGVNPIGMSYWRNINNHEGQDIFQVFLSINDDLTIFTLDKRTLNVINERSLNINHTGEGAYFSVRYSNILYYGMNKEFYRFNIDTGIKEIIWSSEYNIWQVHSDYNEILHSATFKDDNWNIIGWGLSDGQKYDLKGEPDECQIDRSGNWLVIKESNNNRIIYIPTGEEKIILNEEGALEHSDCGFECLIGENDHSLMPGALDLIDFKTGEHRFMYSTGIWNMGYVSFTNAKLNTPGQKCLITTPSELISVNFDWPHEAKVICNNLTESQEYENRSKANLCPLGEFAIWTALVNGSLNAYIVRL